MRTWSVLLIFLLGANAYSQEINFENFHTAISQWLSLDSSNNTATIGVDLLEESGVAMTLHSFMKSEGWEVAHSSNYYYARPWPKTVFMQKTGQAPHKEEFLVNSYHFVSQGNKKLILNAGSNSFYIYYNSKDKVAYKYALEFRENYIAYFNKNSPYKNKSLEFDGQVKFLSGVDEIKSQWQDFIFPEDKKQQIKDTIDNFIGKYNEEDWSRYKLPQSRGVILYGPPGTGKSFIASVLISNVLNRFYKNKVTYIHVQSRNIAAAYHIRNIYQVARKYAPSIIFFEDIDLISGTGRTDLADVKNELMQQLSGLETLKGVLTVGTTNYFDRIDYALKRSKRLGFHFNIDRPSFQSRSDLFKMYLKKVPFENEENDIDFTELTELTEGMTGADIKEIVDLVVQNGVEVRAQKVIININQKAIRKAISLKRQDDFKGKK